MGTSSKFLFDTQFETDRETGLAADDSAEAEAKREQERAALIEEGRAMGQAEAAASIEQATAEALAVLSERMQTLHEDHQAFVETMQHSAIKVAIALIKKLLPELVRRNALTEVEGMVQDCLQSLIDEPRALVRVPDPLLDTLRERIDTAAKNAGFAGDVVLLADSGLHGADCRVEWADGGAERDTARLWQDVEEAAHRLFASADELAGHQPEATAQS